MDHVALKYRSDSLDVSVINNKVTIQEKHVNKHKYLEMVASVDDSEEKTSQLEVTKELTQARLSELKKVIQESKFLETDFPTNKLDKFIGEELSVTMNGTTKIYLFRMHARHNPHPPIAFAKIVDYIKTL